MLKALTHIVSPLINQCELSYMDRQPIDYDRAVEQHKVYCNLLRECGLEVIELSVNFSFPDSTFIEDAAVVVDELAIMANMGVDSRSGEVRGMKPELAKYRKIAHIKPLATLEGGDVLRMGRKIFVGISPRTNQAGIESLKDTLEPLNYQVIPVTMKDCLHLKSACSAIADHALLVNPNWIDLEPFKEYQILSVPEDEPGAANVLRINDVVCMHAGFQNTAALLQESDFNIKTIDISELLKAEAGMTCSSIIFKHPV